jgi:CheY-like chemotaxis protein
MPRRRTILIIEDDEAIRDSLKDLFESEGFEVRTATDGRQGLERLREDSDQCLILLDLFMPVMDGSQFLAERDREMPNVSDPVVVVSAAPPDSEVVTGLRNRVSGFVRKPIDVDELLDMVGRFC